MLAYIVDLLFARLVEEYIVLLARGVIPLVLDGVDSFELIVIFYVFFMLTL